MKHPYFLLLPVTFLFSSCEKETVICTGNCYGLNINGKVTNRLTNANVPDIPLTLERVKFTGLFSKSGIVHKFKSGKDGTFSLSPKVDTTIFSDGYFLALKVNENKDYLTIPDRGFYRLYDLSSTSFQNLDIPVYPKSTLKIKLNRKNNDDFQYFQVMYFFEKNAPFFPLNVSSPNDIRNSELNVPTSSDIYTTIWVTKTALNGISTVKIDSIRCTKKGPNIYTIDY